MPITNLSFTNVGPFDEVEFTFDPQVNIFTGPNNSGKSSALWVLGDVAVFPFTFPEKLLRQGKNSTFALHVRSDSDRDFNGHLPIRAVSRDSAEGYWTPERWSEYTDILGVIGYSKFIPALRWSTDFRSPGPTVVQREHVEEEQPSKSSGRSPRMPHLPMRLTRQMARAEREQNPELRRRLALVSENPSLVSDEAVIQRIIDLDYRSYLRRKSEFRNIIVKIGEVASEIAKDFPIEFHGVDEDASGFFPEFSTLDGPIPLNTMSQGTQSIVQWLTHLLVGYGEYYDFPEDLESLPGILIVDEIDAHLHPSWQQRIIPTLTHHFPNLQIFCSTHSPLMLAGLKEGQVQLLQRDDKGNVTVSTNDVDIAGWSADEILRNFLGVDDPTDLETVGYLERLQDLRGREELSTEEAQELEELRHVVRRDLFSGPISAQIEWFTEEISRFVPESSPSTRPLSSERGGPSDRRTLSE